MNSSTSKAMFSLLLNRPASADDVNRFANTVVPQSGRVGAALVLLSSTEYRSNAVRAFYQSTLRRQIAPIERLISERARQSEELCQPRDFNFQIRCRFDVASEQS